MQMQTRTTHYYYYGVTAAATAAQVEKPDCKFVGDPFRLFRDFHSCALLAFLACAVAAAASRVNHSSLS